MSDDKKTDALVDGINEAFRTATMGIVEPLISEAKVAQDILDEVSCKIKEHNEMRPAQREALLQHHYRDVIGNVTMSWLSNVKNGSVKIDRDPRGIINLELTGMLQAPVASFTLDGIVTLERTVYAKDK